jgi:ankyrin repeat protein
VQVREPLTDSEIDCSSVHQAVERSHLGCLRLLLSRSEESGLSFNDKQQTPLLLVQHSLNPAVCCEVTAALLSSASPAYVRTVINAADSTGDTALHRSVYYCTGGSRVCHGCARALLQAGAAPGAVNKRGKPALRVADVLHDANVRARVSSTSDAPPDVKEQVLTLQALQQCGVGVTGAVHLHVVAAAATQSYASHKCAGVRALLACGADPLRRDDRGHTALHAAAAAAAAAARSSAPKGSTSRVSAASTVRVMQLLVAHCSEHGGFGQELLDATNNDGRTALHLSVKQSAVVAALLELGAEIDAQDNSSFTALHLACFDLSAVESVQELLRRSASTGHYTAPLRGHNREGSWLPVHIAAVYGCRRSTESWSGTSTTVELRCTVLDALLASDDCLHQKTSAGCTAVWLVVRHCANCPGVCQYLEALFERGAKLNTYSTHCCTLLLLQAALSFFCCY